MWRWIVSWMLAGGSAMAAESFEGMPAGGFGMLESRVGRWSAQAGHAEVHAGHAKAGNQSLRLVGGSDRQLELTLERPLEKAARLVFWAERWTARKPFSFRVEAGTASGSFEEVYNGDGGLKVGGFLVRVEVPLKAGVARLRMRCTAPPDSGVMIDEMELVEEKPMRVVGVETVQPVVPVLAGRGLNPVLGMKVVAEGNLEPRFLEAVELSLEGTTRTADVDCVTVMAGVADPSGGFDEVFGELAAGGRLVVSGRQELVAGDNWFWVSVKLKDGADIDGRVDAAVTRVRVSGEVIEVAGGSPPGSQRIGIALRRHGDDGSQGYRIPGLATTNEGTLIGVYDIRRRGGGDLPGDIDIGMSRSTDGGQTWEPMKVIMDMGDDPKWNYDGIGDPAVLVDKGNNRVWVAGTWSHGNRSWLGSGKGMKPEETGQFMLVHSDDDGRTWSQPLNITGQVKDPDWHFILQGPGRGITMKDGTIVFPAQFQAGDSKRTPHSTLIHSKDHGRTWTAGSGVKSNTTEAQLVELGDGSIMINCRDNRGGTRTVATTTDLGRTWQMHPTDRTALNEPVCMASLLRIEHPKYGPLLVFSNPNTPLPGVPRGRYNMTIKLSSDEGMTWPEKWHSLYDVRTCNGYSCLSPIGEDHVGVLYEGVTEIYFLRFGIDELMGGR